MASVSVSETTLVSDRSDTHSDGSLSRPSYREAPVGYHETPQNQRLRPSPSSLFERYNGIPEFDARYRSRERFESASNASFDGNNSRGWSASEQNGLVDNTKQNNSKRPTAAPSNKARPRDFSIWVVSVIPSAMKVFLGIFIVIAYNYVLSEKFVMPSISDAVTLPLLLLLGTWIVIGMNFFSSYFLPKTHQGDWQQMHYREGKTQREQILEKEVKDLRATMEKFQRQSNANANINQGASDNPGMGDARPVTVRNINGKNIFMDNAEQHNHNYISPRQVASASTRGEPV